MALFDFLKRKKEIEKKKKFSEKEQEKKSEQKPERFLVKEEKEKLKAPKAKTVKIKGEFSYDIVESPHVSEKGTKLAERNKYIFKISNGANKPEIKKTIEGIYGVDVTSVNIIKIPAKKRRIGRIEGFKKGYSKAVVTVKEGQKIEML